MISLKKIMFMCIAVFVAISNAHANVYQVNDITVEFKRFNAQKIRSYAVDVATKRGFVQLLNNIIPQEYNVKELVDSIDLKKVDVVERLNIVEEINTKGKYFAKFDIIYSQDKIKTILRQKRIPYTQNTMGKVLILPIQQNKNLEYELFGETNKFKTYLFENLEKSLLIKPVMAKGDLQEITTYNPQNILDANNEDRVIQLATKYEANKSLVILLEQKDYEDKDLYQVTINFINFEDFKTETFIVIGKTLKQVSKEVSNKIINLWQQKNLIELNKPKRFVAMINTAGSIDELNATIEHLKTLKMVSAVKITNLTTQYAYVQTDFYGTPKEFLDTAKQTRLNIFKSDNGQWMIERVLD